LVIVIEREASGSITALGSMLQAGRSRVCKDGGSLGYNGRIRVRENSVTRFVWMLAFEISEQK
jgi:hypothetical protein